MDSNLTKRSPVLSKSENVKNEKQKFTDEQFLRRIEAAHIKQKQLMEDLEKRLERKAEIERKRKNLDVEKETKTEDFNSQERARQMNILFDELESANEQLAAEAPVFRHPKLKTKLMAHQNVGVHFMIKQEDPNKDNHPFFEVRPNGKYFNTVAYTYHDECPPHVRGGLLADDMGLGKSIQTIALMLSSERESHEHGGTPLIAPASVIDSWCEQIKEHCVDNAFKILIHMGDRRIGNLDLLRKYDIVLTSYETCHNEPNEDNNGLKALHWHRIVLDEGHLIRNNRSKRFKTIVKLKATNRWCLSGTPIVNTSLDVFAICSFLRCAPFDDLKLFKKTIANPIKRAVDSGVHCLQACLKSFTLRRDKTLLQRMIPPKTITVEKVYFPLDSPHRLAYKDLFDAFFNILRRLPTDHILSNFAYVLELITRLRQIACSAELVPRERIEMAKMVLEEFEGKYGKGDDIVQMTKGQARALFVQLSNAVNLTRNADRENAEERVKSECCICLEFIDDPENARIIKKCSHFFCTTCINRVLQLAQVNCPLCKQSFCEKDLLTIKNLREQLEGDADEDYPAYIVDEVPPKVKALLQFLLARPEDEKTLVFSNFRKFLDIIRRELKNFNIENVTLDGTMNRKERKIAINRFRHEDNIKVFLISMKAGGVGLNLTRANNVVLTDLWWNRAVENQAMDRIHRLGQEKPCKVVKLMTSETIEERIYEIQEKKDALCTAAMKKNCPEAMRKLKVLQVIKLFDLPDRD
eukprot:Nk52_evm22s2568 gene=Nk52_evmTU22s2568